MWDTAARAQSHEGMEGSVPPSPPSSHATELPLPLCTGEGPGQAQAAKGEAAQHGMWIDILSPALLQPSVVPGMKGQEVCF